ncbi:MAG: hypothetical protein A3E85_00685 [Gammaproteobacteria bacterium RIFCSPHIGHO2_12_FULL_45_12]|nr:MAG: hypothetical protein A3E85_00685 [Gammaproteobacteria bacterium RIFCSPHIGHO2_12_FULL_45_12]
MTQPRPYRIIQISDTHIAANPERALLGVTLRTSFNAVVELVRQHELNQMDLILLTGDISHDGSETSYLYAANTLKSFNVPVYAILGNHDDALTMASVYPCHTMRTDKQIILGPWQIILLNSHVPGQVHGLLNEQELEYMEHCLQQYPDKQAIIVFHHHPLPVGSQWLDKLGLINARAFWRIISNYANVHTVLFAHVHMAFQHHVQQIPCYSPPSTCIQFKRGVVHFALDHVPPGYRWINLHPNGQLETDIRRTEHYIGVFDRDAKGY